MKYAVDEVAAVVEEACEAIVQLEKEDLPENIRNQAVRHLLASLPYLDHLKYEYPHPHFPFRLFRVRAEKGIGQEESIDQVKTFSYPSPEKCETARANKKGCPVFYVADHAGTALKEAGCAKGDIVYVSEWQITQAEQARLFLFFDHPLPPQHHWEKIRAGQKEQFNQSMANIPEAVKNRWQGLHTAYCKAFLGDDYGISSLIGHELLHANKKPDVQILVYPSKIDGEHCCNLAIHPGFADSHLQMNKVWKIKVTDEKFVHKPELLQTGEVSADKITWSKATEGAEDDLPL
jgi:hypothetical protein